MTRRQQEGVAAQPARLSFGRRLMVMAASALATLALAVLVFVAWGVWSYTSPGPSARQGAATTVILRHGASLPEIASNLEQAGVVRSGSVFVAAAQATGAARSLKAGEYAFPSRASLGTVLTMIRTNQIVRHFITVPEGATSEQAVAILAASDVLAGSAPTPPEGSLLPETYEVE
ncbi:MAG: endolytic transglycosylase MltG, partial [Phenylobacterium sp.]